MLRRNPMTKKEKQMGKDLVLDELFDLTLYRMFERVTDGKLQSMLQELIVVEERHYQQWQDFFDIHISKLGTGRKIKLWTIYVISRLLGDKAIYLFLDSIEIYGINKYLIIWEKYKDEPLGKTVRGILDDELEHEDTIVSEITEKKMSAQYIRNVFLGFNDGLVEVLGAVSGFFAAFGTVSAVLIAGFTVAVAGAFSMAAGFFVALGSEREVENIERKKQEYLGNKKEYKKRIPLFQGSLIVGISYILGAMVPVLPVLFGVQHVGISFLLSAIVVVLVSLVLSFMSGMDIRRRIVLNLLIISAAVLIAFVLGSVVRSVFGVAL